VRLLLDMGVARRAAILLREGGMDAVHLGERGLSRLPDADVLRLADSEGRVVVTLDAHFAAFLALSGATRPSVIHLRMEGLAFAAQAELVSLVCGRLAVELEAGCVVSVTAQGLRVRRLPIAPGS
jgi:predicted nuclease of predicted toxin-antitoxin system